MFSKTDSSLWNLLRVAPQGQSSSGGGGVVGHKGRRRKEYVESCRFHHRLATSYNNTEYAPDRHTATRADRPPVAMHAQNTVSQRSALEAGASSMILLTSAAAGTEAGAAPPMCPSALSPNTVLPMARVSLDLLPPHVVASSGSGEGRSLSPDSGRAYSGRGDSPEQHRQSIGKVGGWLPKGDFILGGGRGMGLGGSRGEKGGSSTAIGTTTTEMATGDGARSAGRVLKVGGRVGGRVSGSDAHNKVKMDMTMPRV